MRTSFRFEALPAERFVALFDSSDAQLQAIGARRVVVDVHPGYPCRVSLTDADLGETVLSLSWVHHDVASPYRASGPIFVRPGVPTATPAVDEVPPMFDHRLLSLRGYDAGAMMVAADVVAGSELESAIRRMFEDAQVGYLHVHNAKPGCFNCRVVRA